MYGFLLASPAGAADAKAAKVAAMRDVKYMDAVEVTIDWTWWMLADVGEGFVSLM